MQGRKHQVTSHCCLYCMTCSLMITDLTNHYNIRILSQDISQNRGECHIDKRLYSNLVKLLVHHFNRIFHRHNIRLRRSDLFQSRVEGCRFTASRRSCYQNDSMGRMNERVIHFCIPFRKAKIFNLLKDHIRIENTHYHLFTKSNRNG